MMLLEREDANAFSPEVNTKCRGLKMILRWSGRTKLQLEVGITLLSGAFGGFYCNV